MIKALTFDLFGTLLDWKNSIIKQGQLFSRTIDWETFAIKWAHSYSKSISNLNYWENLEDILYTNYYRIKPKGLSNSEHNYLAQAWTRLDPWSDSIHGLELLKQDYLIVALSNANTNMLLKYDNLPFDMLLSAESVEQYKPADSVYKMAIERTGVPVEQITMVASHIFDLKAASKLGFKTALIDRIGETDLMHNFIPDYIVKDVTILPYKLN